ncbi:MAG: DUF6599 family protein [Acidobacteriota bacterium]
MLSIPLLVSLLAAAPTTRDLLPPDGFLGKWQKSGVARVFRGADLYGHINGGSELFLEFGFEELVVQDYKSGADELSLELYRMTDPVAATGIYLMKAGAESSGRLSFAHTFSPYQLLFARDRYLIILNNLDGKQEMEPEMIELARHLAGRLPEQPGPTPVPALSSHGLLPGTTRFIRGSYALQSVFTLGAGNILSLSPGQTAVSGDYEVAGKKWTLILSDYPTPALARGAFDYLVGHLDPYLKPIGRGNGRLVFEDYNSEYGLVALSGSRLEITVHLKQKP